MSKRERAVKATSDLERASASERGEARRRSAPAALKQYLNERVIGQRQMVDAVVDTLHLAAIRKASIDAGVPAADLPKQQALLVVSETGTGKTHLFEVLAQRIDADVTFIDASALTGRGWRGLSVDDALAPVARRQAEDPGRLQILVWDEFDKMGYHSGTADRSFNPCKDLLKLLDGGEVSLEYDGEGGKTCRATFDTVNVVHVLAGAFEGIEEIVERRAAPSEPVGFNAGPLTRRDAASARLDVRPGDLEEWGIPRELVGRIGGIVSMPPLSEEAMRAIVSGGEHSLAGRYGRMLARAGISLSVSDEASADMARAAVGSGLGARFLATSLAETVSRAVAEADAESATEIRIVSRDDRPAYELGGVAAELPPGWTLGPEPPAVPGANDSDDPAEADRAAVVRALNSAIGERDVFHGFRDAGQFDRAAELFMQASGNRLEAPGRILSTSMKYMIDRYREDEQNLGTLCRMIDLFSPDDPLFGIMSQMALDDARESCDEERIAWYSMTLEEFEDFRKREDGEQRRAIACAREALLRGVYDRDHAEKLRAAIDVARSELE